MGGGGESYSSSLIQPAEVCAGSHTTCVFVCRRRNTENQTAVNTSSGSQCLEDSAGRIHTPVRSALF